MKIFLLSLTPLNLSLTLAYENTSLKKRIKKHYFIFNLEEKPRVSLSRKKKKVFFMWKKKFVKHFSHLSDDFSHRFISYYSSTASGTQKSPLF